MRLTLMQSTVISELAGMFYDFLPGSGRPEWKSHITFGTVAKSVGVGEYWAGGSKRTAIHNLLAEVLRNRPECFEPLIVEIVHRGITYRRKHGAPVTPTDIDRLNGSLLRLGFKFPDLHDAGFLASLGGTPPAASDAGSSPEGTTGAVLRAALAQLYDQLLQLHAQEDRQGAGVALEGLLGRLFELFDLKPRQPFRVVGEQIDGAFELDGEVYLVEAKWKREPVQHDDLAIFWTKIQAKSAFTRGMFVALNGVTDGAKTAIRQGKPMTFFVITGHDLMMVLRGALPLPAFLRARVRILLEEGEMFVPFNDLTEGSRCVPRP